jgi:hypothetical protein
MKAVQTRPVRRGKLGLRQQHTYPVIAPVVGIDTNACTCKDGNTCLNLGKSIGKSGQSGPFHSPLLFGMPSRQGVLKAIGTRYAKDGNSSFLNKLLQNAVHIHRFLLLLKRTGHFF